MKPEELVSYVRLLLAKRFPNSIEKQKIDESNDKKLNFACPFCGDSEKKASKKRGNVWFETETYKCFNDGCMEYMSLSEFVSRTAKRFGISIPSFILESEFVPTAVKARRTENQFLRFMTSDTSQLITVSEVINRFGLVRLDQVNPQSRVYQYIKGRDLTDIPDYGDVLYCDSSDNKILIFNMDKRSGRLLGFAIRHLNPDVDRKYIIRSYSDLVQIFAQKNLEKDLVDDANFLNNYFNILNVDFSKPPILLTEGQFDSMILTNCIATTGVSKARHILPNLGAKSGTRILFDKDKGGKDEMMILIKQGYSVLLWNKILSDLKKKCQTTSDFIKITEIKDINDLYTWTKTHWPMSITEFNLWIRSYFSDSVYDIAYL